MRAAQEIVTEVASGVFLVDADFIRPELAASFLVRGKSTSAFVEVGTALSTPRLLKALAALGMTPADVGYVIVTHIHLNHAGGAGSLMQALPEAKLVVHPRGARHMADPTALIEGATQVYGAAAIAKNYGAILPVAKERIVEAQDGLALDLGDRRLTLVHTPGHAKHHLVVYDDASRGVFTGDTFGLSYPGLATPLGRFIFPTTTPVQFDPEALKASIDRILGFSPERIYLTHYGLLEGELRRYAEILKRLVDAHVEVVRRVGPGSDLEVKIKVGLEALLREELRRQGVNQDHGAAAALWDMDMQLNAQGLVVWRARS